MIVGAGAGIGEATAVLLSREGAMVVLVDRDAEALSRVKARIGGPEVHLDRVDCLVDEEVGACVNRTVEALGRIDILVNGVGGSTVRPNQGGSLDSLSVEDWHALVGFNLTPTFLFCRYVIPVMKRRGNGKIVNISSIAARGEGMSNAAYSAAKAGINALTRRVSREVAPFGIHCNAVSPGLTMSNRMKAHLETLSAEAQQKALSRIPLGRYATPEDQAEVIAFLASYQSDFVTGVNIDVSGGQ